MFVFALALLFIAKLRFPPHRSLYSNKFLRAQRSEAKRSGASLARELPVGVMGQKNNCVSRKRSILGLWFIEEKMFVFTP